MAQLERALALEEKTGVAPKHKLERGIVPGVAVPGFIGIGEEVDSIAFYAAELKSANADVSERIDSLLSQPSLMQCPSDGTEPSTDINSDEELGFLSFAKTSAMSLASNVKQNTTTLASGATDLVGKAAKAGLSLVKKDDDGQVFSAGFVVFQKLSAVQTALQLNHHNSPFKMECLEAPEPEDINWSNIGKEHKELEIGRLISLAATSVACLLWTIPVTFVASLSSVDALRKEVGVIDDMLNALPFLTVFFEVLAPQVRFKGTLNFLIS